MYCYFVESQIVSLRQTQTSSSIPSEELRAMKADKCRVLRILNTESVHPRMIRFTMPSNKVPLFEYI